MASSIDEALARFGPGRSYPPVSAYRAQVYCSRLATHHYENFSVASLLLPRHLHRHFHNVYAYCRLSDDFADESSSPGEAVALLRWWREELIACYSGEPHHPVMVALHGTVRRFGVPVQPFLDLLSAFERDQTVQTYRTYEQLREYCRFSANPVGRIVLYLCDAFSEERAQFSDFICTALQLTNFWQDVARDFSIGRVYLPEEDRQRFGYDDGDLKARRFTPAFAELLRFEVDRARDLFYRGFPLMEMVRSEVRADLELFVQGGLAVLRKIEAIEYNVWERRPALAKWEKAALVSGALWRRLRPALAVW